MSSFTPENLRSFAKSFEGDCILPSSDQFTLACRLYNSMIDRKPALVLRCHSEASISAALRFARQNAGSVSIKSGGHNLSGIALNPGGITIDVSSLRTAQLDESGAFVLAQAGCRLGDIDEITGQVNKAVPLGTVSDTGVGGLALGGGIGWLLPYCGLTCDNIEELELVDHGGNTLVVNENSNADLFWALCGGGGGNFGVVKKFRFRLYPVSEVFGGSVIYKLSDLPLVVEMLDQINSSGDKSLCASLTISGDSAMGDNVSVDLCSLDIKAGSQKIQRILNSFATPLKSTLHVLRFREFQRLFDAAAKHGFRRYGKSLFIDRIDRDFALELVELFRRRPSAESTIFIEEFHGNFRTSRFQDSAFGNRDARFNLNIQGCWSSSDEDSANLSWLRATIGVFQRYARNHGSYVNYNSDLNEAKTTVYSNTNIDRLGDIKKRYDPDNFFSGTISSRHPTRANT